MKSNLKNNIFILIKFIILFLSCLIIYKNLNIDRNFIYLNDKFNISFSIILFILFFISSHLQIYITLETITKKLIKRINYIYFAKLFFNSQIISIILPHSGLVYRAYQLKKLKLSYTDFVGISYFLAWFNLFFFLIFYSFEFLIFGSEFENYRYTVFLFGIFSSSIIYSLPFLFYSMPMINFKNKIIKKIYEYFRYIFLIPIEFKKKNFFKFLSIYGIVGHIINFFMIFIAVKAININFTFSQIVIFFIIYSFLGQVPITPKNLGISELVFGLTSINMGMGFEIGFFIILILRLFSFFNLIFFVIIYNLIPIKNYK